jgi:NADH:ubiquinone oxidoreductase subunit F (NADH-binding)
LPEVLQDARTAPSTTIQVRTADSFDGLLRPIREAPEDLTTYRRAFPVVEAPAAQELVEVLKRAALRGRGGAGFPAWRKVEAVASRKVDGPVAVVANGEEGEPASCKDRYLLRHRPHVVLEGLEILRRALDADSAYVYVSDEVGHEAIRQALAERADETTQVFLAPRGYVSGEESAVVRALNGGPALPTQKPPRPFEAGVSGWPTVVMNVETLARVCQTWTASRLSGDVRRAADQLLLTLIGPDRVVLTEVQVGTRLRDVVQEVLDIDVPAAAPVLAGGFFSGFLPPAALDIALSVDDFRAAGTGLGCGSFIVLPDACPVDVATDVMAFFDRENAHQCGSCFKGTAAMHQALVRIGGGSQQDDDVAKLSRWSHTLVGRGSCATLDGAASLARTLLERFGDVVAQHAEVPCPQCAAAAARADVDTRFRIPAP